MGLSKMRLSVICLLIWATLLLAACETVVPQIWLETQQIDLGDVVNGDIVERQVTVRNEGQVLLVVTSIFSSCGCTQAALDPMQIEPGQEATLAITLDSGAHGPGLTGPLLRQIFITSNDPHQAEVIVELTADIQARPAEGG